MSVGASNPAADGNHNGTVDSADYVIWRNNQGATLPGTATGAGFDGAAVPEPCGSVYVLLPSLATWLTQRFR